MSDLGRSLLILGCIIAFAGAVLMLSGKLPWLGRLPGDIYVKKENFSVFFPITTCILLSLIISLILWFIRK
ncbi:MAG TPA: DUF2905 domain-containing protein [Geobacteraceae bacterium]|nr:DUF2905 domain-containing protein [Geobacteraceae bacterium]